MHQTKWIQSILKESGECVIKCILSYYSWIYLIITISFTEKARLVMIYKMYLN